MSSIIEDVIKAHIEEGDNVQDPVLASERYLRAIAKGIQFLVEEKIRGDEVYESLAKLKFKERKK